MSLMEKYLKTESTRRPVLGRRGLNKQSPAQCSHICWALAPAKHFLVNWEMSGCENDQHEVDILCQHNS